MKILLALTVLVTACADHELYDPTGTWDLVAHWGVGSCQLTGTSAEPLLVLDARDHFEVRSNDPNESITGTVFQTETSATISVNSVVGDVLDDGGSVTGVISLNATADEASAITGSGGVRLSGGIVCTHPFSITGTLR